MDIAVCISADHRLQQANQLDVYLNVAMEPGVVAVNTASIIIKIQGTSIFMLEQPSGQRPEAAVAFMLLDMFKLFAIQLQFAYEP